MYRKGFTLIELLVVVAIIGILASVVLASLTSARNKGKEATIKSNLKNMIGQAEVSYNTTIPNNYSTACTGVANMITGINNTGGTASCYTFDNTRWGASAKFNSDTTKNWAVDSMGVVTWDTTDAPGGTMMWDAANTACAALGSHLPSLEQLKTFYTVYGAPYPNSFPNAQSGYYWSSTLNSGGLVQSLYTVDGNIYTDVKTHLLYARCVH